MNRSVVANDVYERFCLRPTDFPSLATPCAHADEVELFCAKQSMAAYSVQPSLPFDQAHDFIPSRQRDEIKTRALSLSRLMTGWPDSGPESPLEQSQGYRAVASDRAGALLVWKGDHLVVAFRGTANWQDWIHNFSGRRVLPDFINERREIDLHKGFKGLAENIAPAVDELLAGYLGSRKSPSNLPPILTLCGHSLGGALALHYAARLASDPILRCAIRWGQRGRAGAIFRIGATYTFGAPRIGKGSVWEYISRPHYRLIVRGDPVPSTPPFCTDDFEGAYLDKPEDTPTQPVGTLGKIWKALKTKSRFGINLNSHDIESYVEAIEAKIAAKARDLPGPGSSA